MFDPELVDHDEQILHRHQPHISGIPVVVFPRPPNGAVVEEVGRLAAQPAQRPLETADARLQRGQNGRGGDPLRLMEMGQMDLRVRDGVQNHGVVSVHLRRRGGSVMIRVFDVVCADLQEPLRELHGILQPRCAGDRTSPDGAHRAVHLHPDVGGLPDAPLRLLPVLGQRRPGIRVVMFGIRGHHHQDPVGADAPLAELDRRVHGRLPDGDGRKGDRGRVDAPPFAVLPEAIPPEVGQDLLRVSKLGDAGGIPQVGQFDVPAARQDHLFGIENLGRGRNGLLLMLESIPNGDVADGHLLRHAWKDLPVIVFRHFHPSRSMGTSRFRTAPEFKFLHADEINSKMAGALINTSPDSIVK